MYEFEKKKLLNYLGKHLASYLEGYNCIIAGGAITSLFCNREINDIDVYFRSKEDALNCVMEMYDDKYWVMCLTDKAVLFVKDNLKIQTIFFKYFDEPEDIFKTFDFTTCMGAYDFKKKDFVFHEDFLKHNSQRILKFNPTTDFPIISALRVQKYEDKGYTISKPEYVSILLSCMNLKINNIDELKKQIGGMYGVNYDKVFKQIKDSDEIDYLKIIKIIKDLSFSDEYFDIRMPDKEFNREEIICKISDKKIDYFEKDDRTYIIRHDGTIVFYDIDDYTNYNKIAIEDWIKDKKFYKWVNKKDNHYWSFYDKTYEYHIGDYAEPKSNDALYCGEFSAIDRLSFATYDTRALLELEVEADDFVNKINRAIKVKKLKVIREVSKAEIELMQQIEVNSI